jgi:hypothetical protein
MPKEGRRLLRRVVPIGACAILASIVLYSAVLCMRLQTRYTVIGTTDPATGVRIEYTVSSRYRQKRDETDKSTSRVHDAFTDWQFTPSSPPPWMRWFYKNVLKNSEAALSDLEGSSDVTQTNSKRTTMAGWYVDTQGYVRVDLKGTQELVMAAVASQECRMVGDCPTTLVIEDSDISVNGHSMQYYDLLGEQQRFLQFWATSKISRHEIVETP